MSRLRPHRPPLRRPTNNAEIPEWARRLFAGIAEPIPPILTPMQVARILQVGRTKVYELLRSGRVPSFSLDPDGRNLRIRADALFEHIKSLEKEEERRCKAFSLVARRAAHRS